MVVEMVAKEPETMKDMTKEQPTVGSRAPRKLTQSYCGCAVTVQAVSSTTRRRWIVGTPQSNSGGNA